MRVNQREQYERSSGNLENPDWQDVIVGQQNANQ